MVNNPSGAGFWTDFGVHAAGSWLQNVAQKGTASGGALLRHILEWFLGGFQSGFGPKTTIPDKNGRQRGSLLLSLGVPVIGGLFLGP